MPFDHSTFTPEVAQGLLESQREDNMMDGFHYNDPALVTDDSSIIGKVGSKPKEELPFQYGRTDRTSEIAAGDRAVVFNHELGVSSWQLHSFAATRGIDHIDKANYDALARGGALDRLSQVCAKQVMTDCEVKLKTIVSGGGSSSDETAVTNQAVASGDEFNDDTPAKTPEAYFIDAIHASGGGSMMFACQDVIDALIQNPNLAENDLNQHSMTLEEFRSWLAARGITTLVISKQKAQGIDPRQGLSLSYIHAGVCAIGQPGAIIRYVMNDLNYRSARDELADTDYVIAAADMDWRVPYKESVVAFTNTLA